MSSPGGVVVVAKRRGHPLMHSSQQCPHGSMTPNLPAFRHLHALVRVWAGCRWMSDLDLDSCLAANNTGPSSRLVPGRASELARQVRCAASCIVGWLASRQHARSLRQVAGLWRRGTDASTQRHWCLERSRHGRLSVDGRLSGLQTYPSSSAGLPSHGSGSLLHQTWPLSPSRSRVGMRRTFCPHLSWMTHSHINRACRKSRQGETLHLVSKWRAGAVSRGEGRLARLKSFPSVLGDTTRALVGCMTSSESHRR